MQLTQQVARQAEGSERGNSQSLNMNDNTEPFSLASIQRPALPAYLHWLCEPNSEYYRFYNPRGGVRPRDLTKPLLNAEDCQALIALCRLHFLRHPLFPSIRSENGAPVGFEYETEEQIYCHTVRDFLEFSMKHRNPHLFRYLWSNWLRPFHRISGRWDLISIADCDTILHARTTARIEQHWKLLKHKFMKLFIRPRMDLLIYIIIYHLFPFKR